MADSRSKTITLTIDSSLEQVALLGVAVQAVCLYSPLTEMEAYQVRLCVVEAVNNIIKHAYALEANHPVEVTMTLMDERLSIDLRDEGSVASFPEGLLGREGDSIKDGGDPPEQGYGLHIVLSVMENVRFERLGEQNFLRMEKTFAPDPARERADESVIRNVAA
ncbi:ATP-binding protein [Desulfonatronum thioautotrophicum]|uniref:ATP-binding protein n=1 Tax=Desulfonatronum thioautotrophicum TaxID=617001 RepID=UPI0006997D2C|nr:ATP-binding protein [Desulfonatronum thioautotrophicum]